jgi:ligand-binding SRPBCC domain-containing protein
MKIHTLEAEQFIGRSLPEVFEFFSRPENLARITPPSLGFVILTPSPIEMKAGTSIDYTIRIAGIPLRWRTLISIYDPPNCFVDEQLKGPYAYWRHTHRFSSVEGGTMIHDQIRYAIPFGLFGALARRLFVRRNLDRIFSYRKVIIEKILVDSSIEDL